jgi:hypothetical protein
VTHAALFAVALLARGVAVVASTYSDWLLRVLMEGYDAGYAILLDGWTFLDFLREVISHQFFGSPSHY